MVIENYGIKLKRLEWEDIEMVRMWRNSDFVRKYMLYKDYISIEMQKKWFYSISNDRNYFFIIYLENYPVGLTEVKNINNKVGNLGIFFATPEVLKNVPMLSYRVIFSMVDLAFTQLKLEKLEASVYQDNIRAKHFNESFGFIPIDSDSTKEFENYVLIPENYRLKSKKIKKLLERT